MKDPLTLTQTLATNLVRLRAERNRSQRSLAEDMRLVGGHKWTDVTVSNVERGDRSVSVDELGALAVILGASPVDLLTPLADVKVGPDAVIEKELFAAWLEGFGTLRFDAGKVTYDSNLALQFFKRRGLIVNGDE
jgi:transcriptional regulator with XRE-family HTH domain